jgi:hypothetical protein
MKLTPMEYTLIGVVLILTNLVTLFSGFAFAMASVLFQTNWLLYGIVIAPVVYLFYGFYYVNSNVLEASLQSKERN